MGLSRIGALLEEFVALQGPTDDLAVSIYALMGYTYLLGKTDSRISKPSSEWHDGALLLTWSRRGLYLEVEVSPDRQARAVFLPQDPAQGREGEWIIGDPLPDWLAGALPDFYDMPEQGDPG